MTFADFLVTHTEPASFAVLSVGDRGPRLSATILKSNLWARLYPVRPLPIGAVPALALYGPSGV